MFSNLKDFISVVQEGLTTNNNLRTKLQEVQKVKLIFSDRQKTNANIDYSAGGELLDKYQQQWAEIHNNAERNAKAAEEADKTILQLHELAKTHLKSATDMALGLSYLPSLTASVAQCADNIKNIQAMVEQVESDMTELEDLFERNKMEQWKLDHHYQLSVYKEKKLTELEAVRTRLSKENSEMSCEREKKKLAELQRKRDLSAAAFENDISKYLSSGSIPIAKSPQQNLTLDQVQLDEDKDDLEKFLDS